MISVYELLTASRAAHLRYRQHAGRIDAAGLVSHQPNDTQAEQAVQDAYDLRSQAHAADPEHADAAWTEDRAPDAELMAFYRTYLGLS